MRTYDYDVVIAGGGPAGVSAALSSAACGKKTVLIEKNGYLGGECASSNVPAYCGIFDRQDPPAQIAEGTADEFLRHLTAMGMYSGPQKTPGKNYCVPVEPECVKVIFDRMTEEKCHVFLHSVIADAKTEEGRIVSVICSDPDGLFEVRGKAFVDCTGDAVLSYLTGAETSFGNEDGKVQSSAMVMMISGFDPQQTYTTDQFEEAVRKGKEQGIGPFSRNKGSLLRWLYKDTGTISVIAEELKGTDHEALTTAEQNCRRQAQAYLQAFRNNIPGMEHVKLISTGHSIGIRESRRIIGKETLQAVSVRNAVHLPDGVGRGVWPIEIHRDPEVPATFEYLPEKNSWYDIPLGILQSVNIENLFAAGRCVSAEPDAFASIRVGGTCFVTGQAAGTAAALMTEGVGISVQSVRECLLKQNALV